MKIKEPPTWSLEFINDSHNVGDICLFQRLVHPPSGTTSLVWLTRAAAPTTRVLFTWTEEYQFYWRERHPQVRRSAIITASQLWTADLDGENQVTFSRDRCGRYSFLDLEEGPNAGKLYIVQDRTVSHGVEIGVGMGGFPAHVVQAQPNLTTIFRAEVSYWIAFGTFEQSDSLDVSEIYGGVELLFPKNVHSMTATLRRDNTWVLKAAPRRRRKTTSSKTARPRKRSVVP